MIPALLLFACFDGSIDRFLLLVTGTASGSTESSESALQPYVIPSVHHVCEARADGLRLTVPHAVHLWRDSSVCFTRVPNADAGARAVPICVQR